MIGVRDPGHLGRMLICSQRGVRLGQVYEIKITFDESIYVQLDGEPWLEQSQVTYHIRRLHQVLMLNNIRNPIK